MALTITETILYKHFRTIDFMLDQTTTDFVSLVKRSAIITLSWNKLLILLSLLGDPKFNQLGAYYLSSDIQRALVKQLIVQL